MKDETVESSLAELQARARKYKAILAIVGVLAVIYAGALLWWFATGSWTDLQTLGIVGLVVLIGGLLPAWSGLGRVRALIRAKTAD